MAEKIHKPSLQKASMIHGLVVRAGSETGAVDSIVLPELDERFVVIGPKDIKGSNGIKVMDDTIPLFATDVISHPGQPVLALFGPDAESVGVKVSEIKILCTELDPQQPDPVSDRTHSPVQYAWGDAAALVSQAQTVFERTYADMELETEENQMVFVTAYTNDDLLIVESPTQWPHHMRDTIADICAKKKQKVQVLPQPGFSQYDEKLIQPSVLGAIAALAVLKTGKTARIASRQSVRRPMVSVTRRTAMDESGMPYAETAAVTVDQGTVPLFSSEMFRQMLAGLVPFYPLKGFAAQVSFIASHKESAHFHGDLGYSPAVFSSEAHASAIARETRSNPATWRIRNYSDSDDRSNIVQTLPVSKLRDLLNEAIISSDFSRHHAVYELQRKGRRHLVSTFPNYARGIGVSCGAGVGGFSSQFPMLSQYKLAITLNANNKVLVDTSFFPSDGMASLWKATISKELGVESESISFTGPGTNEMSDTGPNVLSRDVERASFMLGKCCAAIKTRRFQDPLPITESITSKVPQNNPSQLFSSGNWGTVVVELEVDTVSLEIGIRRIWCHFIFANVHDTNTLTARFRRIIMSTLTSCGASPYAQAEREPRIDISIENLGATSIPGSASSALRGMVMAAYASALTQALDSDITSMPASADDIARIARRSE